MEYTRNLTAKFFVHFSKNLLETRNAIYRCTQSRDMFEPIIKRLNVIIDSSVKVAQDCRHWRSLGCSEEARSIMENINALVIDGIFETLEFTHPSPCVEQVLQMLRITYNNTRLIFKKIFEDAEGE